MGSHSVGNCKVHHGNHLFSRTCNLKRKLNVQHPPPQTSEIGCLTSFRIHVASFTVRDLDNMEENSFGWNMFQPALTVAHGLKKKYVSCISMFCCWKPSRFFFCEHFERFFFEKKTNTFKLPLVVCVLICSVIFAAKVAV